jgi:hypothetical protein
LSYHVHEAVEQMYDTISDILHQEGRGQVNAIVMRDFYSIVGVGSTNKVVGLFGPCRRNEREARCSSTSASNRIWFKERGTKLYTWKSPGNWKHYQIDNILAKQRFSKTI